jgi:hypothetical protein
VGGIVASQIVPFGGKSEAVLKTSLLLVYSTNYACLDARVMGLWFDVETAVYQG